MTFGVSTHLFHNEVLDAAHLATIRRHGFDAVEVFATPTHVDYRSRERAAEIAGWLKAEGLRAHSIHAPITSALRDGAWGDVWSNASVDATLRQAAIAETERAMDFAATIGARFVVIHLGIPDGMKVPAADNDAGVLARSLAAMATAARSFDLTLALEVIPNHLSTPEALVERLDAAADDETDELAGHGICLDVGHAHMMAARGARGAVDAVEVVGGHLVTTHIHDNNGRSDDHLVPFQGTIDWSALVMAFQKVGYDGTWMFEIAAPAAGTDADATLARAAKARQRLEALGAPIEF